MLFLVKFSKWLETRLPPTLSLNSTDSTFSDDIIIQYHGTFQAPGEMFFVLCKKGKVNQRDDPCLVLSKKNPPSPRIPVLHSTCAMGMCDMVVLLLLIRYWPAPVRRREGGREGGRKGGRGCGYLYRDWFVAVFLLTWIGLF